MEVLEVSLLPSRAALEAAAVVEALDADCAGTLTVAVPGLVAHRAGEVLPLASVGQLLVLAEAARRIADGTLDPTEQVGLLDTDYCGGSGLLTGLSTRQWSVAELALLTAAVSDNTATNALLRRLGLAAVNEGAAELGLHDTRVLDRIREPRLAEHAPTFAVGTAAELAALAARIAGPGEWQRIMLGWMAANTDRTMVPALIPHEPEDDRVPEDVLPLGAQVLWLADKTGTDVGMRTDVGVVVGTARRVGYAVLGNCKAGEEFSLLQAMRGVGPLVADYASRL